MEVLLRLTPLEMYIYEVSLMRMVCLRTVGIEASVGAGE